MHKFSHFTLLTLLPIPLTGVSERLHGAYLPILTHNSTQTQITPQNGIISEV